MVIGTTDAMHLIGFYEASAETTAVGVVSVTGVTFRAVDDGGHWEEAGGDSGLFVIGAKSITVKDCVGLGSRDATVYPSGSIDRFVITDPDSTTGS